VLQGLRVGAFITLPCLYFGLRNDDKEYDNSDAERQALLNKKLSGKLSASGDVGAGTNGYGATNQEQDNTDTASEAGSDDSYLDEQQKKQALIEKRLKQDGNWFTYAKGFTVSWKLQHHTFWLLILMVLGVLPLRLALS